MGIFTNHNFPYTDFHELNLDWVIAKIKELNNSFDDFKAVNTIKNGGNWDISKQYERWTIVNYNNMGYLSLKPVPSGIAISNTDYWQMVADYSTVIAGLIQRIDDMEDDIEAVEDRMTDTETLVNNFGATVNALNKKINGKYIVIGDSYGLDDVRASGGTPWSKHVINHFPNAIRSCAGGSGFVWSTPPDTNWIGLLQNAVASLTDPTEVTKVLVMGGANDAVFLGDQISENELKTAIDTFCSWARTNIPNATIYLAFVGNNHNNVATYYDRFRWCKRIYRDKALTNTNLVYCAGGDYILADPTRTQDLLHPTQKGSDNLGQFAIDILAGEHNSHMIYQNQPLPTANTNFVIAGLGYSFGKYTESGYDYFMGGSGFNGCIGIKCEVSTTFNYEGVDICTFSDMPLTGLEVPVSVNIIERDSGDIHAGYISFIGDNLGKLHMKVHTYDSLTIPANKLIQIPYTTVHIPYFYSAGSHDI